MRRGGAVWAVLVTLAVGACGEEPAACDKSGNDRAFGDCCSESSQCASGVCHKFGDGTQACTQTCSSAADCPAGSQGKKCNGQGVCRT